MANVKTKSYTSSSSNKNDDQDLLTIMATRLAKLEDTLQALKTDSINKVCDIGFIFKHSIHT